jgi:FkbM family methyltransferase
MGIGRYLWQQILKLAWKLVEVLRIKSFIIEGVGKNPILTKMYSVAIAGLQTDNPITINNYKMKIQQESCQGGWIGANMLIKGSYEPCTTRIFKQVLKEGMVAVDVGAHIGYYTLLASSLVGESGKVYAFEPEPQNFSALLGNIVLNGFQNIKPFQKAVFSHSGKMPLYIGTHSGMHSLLRVKDTTSEKVVVDMVSLDETFKKTKVDLVKVDTQGAELNVLMGMQKLIKRCDDLKMIIEFQPNLEHSNSLAKFWDKLIACGFNHIYIIDEGRGKIERANYEYAVDFCKKRRIEGLNLLCAKLPFKEA